VIDPSYMPSSVVTTKSRCINERGLQDLIRRVLTTDRVVIVEECFSEMFRPRRARTWSSAPPMPGEDV